MQIERRQDEDTITLTRVYATPNGQRGVCYRVGRAKKAATLIPDAVGCDPAALRAWLERTTGLPVRDPIAAVERVGESGAERLGAALQRAGTRAEARGREIAARGLIGKLSSPARGAFTAKVTSASDARTTYQVAVSAGSRKQPAATSCTCPAAMRLNGSAPCKHAAALIQTLLAMPDVPGALAVGRVGGRVRALARERDAGRGRALRVA